ncbi:MAG TPA: GTP-binding protein, partial [Nocardioidaceae bacterium]|nr:GTP-binding protein [Nocardioidaceae bacterium]
MAAEPIAEPAGAAAGPEPAADRQNVRNVVLVGHTSAGKTTLVESLLVTSGVLHRAGTVVDGTTVSDHDRAEHRQQRSISLAVAPVPVGNVTVTLLDTPGYADFVGELRAGLRAADAALFVVSAAEAIDDSTRLLWAECAAVGMPRAVVITKLDHPRADFLSTVYACRDAFVAPVLPAYLPLDTGSTGPSALMGMITGRVVDYSSGSRIPRVPTETESATLNTARAELIEGVIEEAEDESLLERYLAGADIDDGELIADLERAVAHGGFHPV